MIILYYIKLAFRQMQRTKVIAATNIIGLAIGIACCLEIYLYVYDELQYDSYIQQKSRVYRIYGNNFGGGEWLAHQPAKFLPLIKQKFPEIEDGTRFSVSSYQIKTDNKIFDVEYCLETDTSIFNIFGWELLQGNRHKVLNSGYSAIISQSTAKKLYGNENPVGKDLFINNETHFTVTGVFKDIDNRSSVKANVIISDSLVTANNWGTFNSCLYIRVKNNTNIHELETKLTNIWNGLKETPNDHAEIRLQAAKDIHLKSGHITPGNRIEYGSIYNVIGFSVIGILILIIACFNYINFATACAQLRGIDVGIRKTTGAKKSSITVQFLIENTLHVLLAIGIAIIITEVTLPLINVFIDKKLSLYNSQASLVPFLAALAIITIACSGAYPSLVMASISPVTAIKSKSEISVNKRNSLSQNNLRQLLVALQFFIVIALIIFAIVVTRQIKYIKQFDAGYNRNRILVILNRNGQFKELHNRYNYIRLKATKFPEVESVTSASNIPVIGINNYGFPIFTDYPQNKLSNIGFVTADWGYLQFLDAEIIEGRNFNSGIPTDSDAIILSQSCVRKAGITDPVGRMMDGFWDGKKRKVIGVMKDVYFNDLHRPLNSAVIMFNHRSICYSRLILIKTKAINQKLLLKKIEKIWLEIAPNWTFQYLFLNDLFEDSYLKERNTGELLNIFTLISIILSLSGLAGLVLFSVQKKTKQIGIRKVHGASVLSIIKLISYWHIKPICFAILISFPAAYMVSEYWLRNFQNKIEISWIYFLISALLTIALALAITCIQVWKAANRNPVESLRYE